MPEVPIRPDLPGNSNKAKEAPRDSAHQERKVDKVINGEATKRKKPLARRAVQDFVKEDFGSVAAYVIREVALPAIKNLVSDIVSEGIDRMLFGDSRRPSHNRSGGTSLYTNYGRMYSPAVRTDVPKPATTMPRTRASYDIQDIVVATRGDAEVVIENMSNLIDTYGFASVADFYDLVGADTNFVDQKWGWNSTNGMAAVRTRDGYIVAVPTPSSIE